MNSFLYRPAFWIAWALSGMFAGVIVTTYGLARRKTATEIQSLTGQLRDCKKRSARIEQWCGNVECAVVPEAKYYLYEVHEVPGPLRAEQLEEACRKARHFDVLWQGTRSAQMGVERAPNGKYYLKCFWTKEEQR